MLEQLDYYNPITRVETIAHLLKVGYGDDADKRQLGHMGLEIIALYDDSQSPHRKLFEDSAGQSLDEVTNSAQGSSRPSSNSRYSFGMYGEHKEDKRQLIVRNLLAHRYLEALALLDAATASEEKTYRHMEHFVQIMMFSGNYKNIQELEYRLQFSFSSGDILDDYFNQLSDKALRSERESISRIKLGICLSYFLEKKFFECTSKFFKFFEDDPIAMISVLKKDDEKETLLLQHEIMVMITVATLVSVPMSNYDDLISIDSFGEVFDTCFLLSRCLKLLINTSFNRFFHLWHHQINHTCSLSYFLHESWEKAQSLMRSKIYCFYLQISKRITISYLSEKLGIDYENVREEITRLIKDDNLNFEIDGDIITYVNRSLSTIIAENLLKNSGKIDKLLDIQKRRNEDLKELIQENIIEDNRTIRNANSEINEQRNQAIINMDEMNVLSDELDNIISE